MTRYYYCNDIQMFLGESWTSILGHLADCHGFALEEQQRNAWRQQVTLLQDALRSTQGTIIFEYSIPRMGKRVDSIILSNGAVFVLEFKISASNYESAAIDQLTDYALDLKNFHEQSHEAVIVPVLICTGATDEHPTCTLGPDKVAHVIKTNGGSIGRIISEVGGKLAVPPINPDVWANSVYKPTPTIIEAAQHLYGGHSVEDISRSDSGHVNLSTTASAVLQIVSQSRAQGKKSICFLTGFPGAGKTLAGLNLVSAHAKDNNWENAVFLSGNGPLVDVLREALARNEVTMSKEKNIVQKKGESLSKAKAFIQNIHHFRDDALSTSAPPTEHVVVFDEAQRAWTAEQLTSFMKKKGADALTRSEPEFLIGVMDRRSDWATIVCLVGGGQEINTGEAGLQEWFQSIKRSFPHWQVHVSDQLTAGEYALDPKLIYESGLHVTVNRDLHLDVCLRSFRSEKVAAFVRSVLDCDTQQASFLSGEIRDSFPVFLTRDLAAAKNWLRSRARGSERFGVVASSGALRLKACGITVKDSVNAPNWFLNGKEDVRSSFFLEDVATEFDIQGLELDWICVAWDANLRHDGKTWCLKTFRGTRWQDVKDQDARLYLKNAYRVLLTTARQGLVIFVPDGDPQDSTRLPEFYDGTYSYLLSLGIRQLSDVMSRIPAFAATS